MKLWGLGLVEFSETQVVKCVPWSLVVLAMLVALLVLVDVDGNHRSITRKSSLWRERRPKSGLSCIL